MGDKEVLEAIAGMVISTLFEVLMYLAVVAVLLSLLAGAAGIVVSVVHKARGD